MFVGYQVSYQLTRLNKSQWDPGLLMPEWMSNTRKKGSADE